MVRRFVMRALAADGYKVDSASDKERGLELGRSGAYELVVLDLMLPALDGISLLRDLMASRPEQRVLVLSALEHPSARVRCLRLGAADYLVKPFAVPELLARVRARLREPAAPPKLEHVLRAGNVTLELRRRVAHGGSGPVSLSEREFLLLQHLIRRRGEVCTREELRGEVWGFGFDPGTNVVDVYVRRLRTKLGADAIQTVRNVGYGIGAA